MIIVRFNLNAKGDSMFQIEIFAQRLRTLRKEYGENQQTVAQLLGTSTTQISDMERGKTTTSFERLVLLCEHYHVPADYLLGLTDER